MEKGKSEPGALFRELERISKPVTPDHSLSLATMLRGWSRHVQRIVGGIHSIPISDSVRWGADDYTAALTIRSLIEDAREQVPSETAPQFDAWLNQLDARFRGSTVPDDAHLLSKWIREESPDGWWWHRVPPSGPVLDDLRAMD